MAWQEIILIASTVGHAFVASIWSGKAGANILIKLAFVGLAVAMGMLAARGLA